MDKLLLTPEEAASVLSIGRSKVYELISDGRLASVRIDASRRVPKSALIEFIERLLEQPEPLSLAQGRDEVEIRKLGSDAGNGTEAH